MVETLVKSWLRAKQRATMPYRKWGLDVVTSAVSRYQL
jgi:hypothetical protein